MKSTQFFTTPEAAGILGKGLSAFRMARSEFKGPEPLEVGNYIIYDADELRRYCEKHGYQECLNRLDAAIEKKKRIKEFEEKEG